MANLIRRSNDDRTLAKFVDDIRARFLTELHNLSVSDDSVLAQATSIKSLIDLWFNTSYFHVGNPKQVAAAMDLQSIFEREGIDQLIFFEIILVAHQVRCLYAVTQNTNRSNQYFSCPDNRVVFR